MTIYIVGGSISSVLKAQHHGIDTEALMAAVQSQQPISVEWRGLYDEHYIFYQLSLSPAAGEEGQSLLYVGIQTDVSNVHMQEARFYQSQKLEALGQLAGGVAHDFNNVLSIIDGYARMAEKYVTEDDEKLAGYLERISLAVRRGSGLTRQLLMFGRHKIASDSTVDLAVFLRDHERLLQPLLDGNITLAIKAENELFVDCPSDSLSQIVMNLVINARDSMPEGGEIFVEACLATSGMLENLNPPAVPGVSYAVLSVSDTGIGMDARTVARIFEPFFTTKEQGKGTGLGLSMVYGIVKERRGRIDVQAQPGEGTTMRVFLPISEKGTIKAIVSTDHSEAGIRFDGYVALVAEDEPDLLMIVSSMLEDMGMEVMRAANGSEALALQDDYEGDIDLLLTDVIMPGLNGVKLAELFQAVREETRVVFMSGFPANGKLAPIDIAEDAILLAKPIVKEKLAAVLKVVLDEESTLDTESLTLDMWQAADA